MVVMLTDLFAPLETVEEGLAQLRHRNHEVVLFHILDETELTFPFEDNTKFLGLEEMPDLIAEPRALRDLTRGGLTMALHDIAAGSGVTMDVDESAIPVAEAQTAACDILGLDYLHIACEGRFLAVVPPGAADRAVEIMRRFEPSARATVIGAARRRLWASRSSWRHDQVSYDAPPSHHVGKVCRFE